MRNLAPSCREITRLQSRALDESLPLRVRFGMKCHLLYCVWCRRYGRQIAFLREALRQDGDRLTEDFAQPLPPEARQRIKDSLRDQSE